MTGHDYGGVNNKDIEPDSVSTDDINDIAAPPDAAQAEADLNSIDNDTLVIFPKGTLDLSGSVPYDLPQRGRLSGHAQKSTTLDGKSGDAEVLKTDTNEQHEHLDIEHLRVKTAADRPSIRLQLWHGSMRNCLIAHDANEIAARFKGCFDASVIKTEFTSGDPNNVLIEPDGSNNSNNGLSFLDCSFDKNAGPDNVKVESNGTGNRTGSVRFQNCLFNQSHQRSLLLLGAMSPVVSGCRFERGDFGDNGNAAHIRLSRNADGANTLSPVVRDCEFIAEGGSDQDYHIAVNYAESALITGCYFQDAATAAIRLFENAVDPNISSTNQFANNAAKIEDLGATRPRWNSVIGGGPLGGVDIGSLTGADVGDLAKADGTTATKDASLWVLKSNGKWQRVDGGAAISPS